MTHDCIVRKQGNGKTLCDGEVQKAPYRNHYSRNHASDAVGQRTRGFGFVDAAINRLEALSGNRAGQWSVRINDQWSVCFGFTNGEATDVEITDYH
ncbi:MAG: type II toxin-antitoxin system RelE/ParE family toxin [Geobacteraceae bacterium]